MEIKVIHEPEELAPSGCCRLTSYTQYYEPPLDDPEEESENEM